MKVHGASLTLLFCSLLAAVPALPTHCSTPASIAATPILAIRNLTTFFPIMLLATHLRCPLTPISKPFQSCTVDTEIIQRIACRVALSVRWPATQHVAPNPKKGTQGCIGPVETIRKAEHIEILTTICKFRQWSRLFFVAQPASRSGSGEMLPGQSQSAKRRRIFRNLEVVKGASDQKRWQILPRITRKIRHGKPVHILQEAQAWPAKLFPDLSSRPGQARPANPLVPRHGCAPYPPATWHETIHVCPHGCRDRAPGRWDSWLCTNTLARLRGCSWPIWSSVWSRSSHRERQWSSRKQSPWGCTKEGRTHAAERFPIAGDSRETRLASRRQPMFSRQACALARSSSMTARSRSWDWRSPMSPYSSKEKNRPFHGSLPGFRRD
jgi:hypothetical protein